MMSPRNKAILCTAGVIVAIPAIIAFIVYFRMAVFITVICGFVLYMVGYIIYYVYREFKQHFDIKEYKHLDPTGEPF